MEEILREFRSCKKCKFIFPQTCFPPGLLYHEKFKIEKLQNFMATNILCFTVYIKHRQNHYISFKESM